MHACDGLPAHACMMQYMRRPWCVRRDRCHCRHGRRPVRVHGPQVPLWQFSGTVLAHPPAALLQALGWLALLLPTHEALRGQGAWAEWAPQWLSLWQAGWGGGGVVPAGGV